MRDFILVFVSALFASALTYIIADHAASAQAHTAAVVTDEEAGAVRIVIDGNEVARFTESGLRVRRDVMYGGITADIGAEHYNPEGAGD